METSEFQTWVTIISTYISKPAEGEGVRSLELELTIETCIEQSSFVAINRTETAFAIRKCARGQAVRGSVRHPKTNPGQHLGTPFLPIPDPASTWTLAHSTGHHKANIPCKCPLLRLD